MSAWSDWADSDRAFTSPYVDWAMTIDAVAPWAGGFDLQLAPASLGNLEKLRKALADVAASAPEATAPQGPLVGAVHDLFPVPSRNNNPGFADYLQGHDRDAWLPDDRDLPAIGETDVVVGVIDVDIALGHRRFRDATGKSRVLAAWQQGTVWNMEQPHMPFGAELSASAINNLLQRFSRRGLTGPLDQEAFDRATGLVDLTRPEGAKALAERFAHGTHVTGLAAGADPAVEPEFSDRVKLLVANLPPPVAYGEGGGLLDHYLIYALHWLTETHLQIAARSGHETPVPLVINISFGKQAGPKEDAPDFVREMRDISARFQNAVDRSLNIFVPAGNDNLTRCNAQFTLAKKPATATAGSGAVQELEWRVLPDDETSNFVEIWSEFLTGVDEVAPFMIDVVPPGGAAGDFLQARNGQVRDLQKGLGRIYCDIVPASDGNSSNVRYQICLAPDHLSSIRGSGAPAGLWKIRFQSDCDNDLPIRASVQTDQATLPGRQLARRSYFEDQAYIRHEPSGRPADTFSYETGAGDGTSPDEASIVKRRGTINSYASKDVVVIGGFRATDGRPAPYSATAPHNTQHQVSLAIPAGALPSDDGYAHFGVLSDGAQDGSVVALRGTSFACACATRLEVERWLGADPGGVEQGGSSKAAIQAQAQKSEAEMLARFPAAAPAKAGSGRIAFQPKARVPRF